MSEPINTTPEENPTVRLVRGKVASAFENEPNAQAEIKDVSHSHSRSKHQQFMFDLSHSGKSLAEIQTEWHNYYVHLPDSEKHEVWQEFYAQHNNKNHHSSTNQNRNSENSQPTSIAELKSSVLPRKPSQKKLNARQNLKSLLFGLSIGVFTILILLFSFFNERFIAPFITPSRTVSSTPIIIDPNSTNVNAEPKLIIPKINLEVPVVYDVKTIEEKAIQAGLEKGVVHYNTTPVPGQQGNVAIVGHSSNNLLNNGKFKFAFVLLKSLEIDDTFYINYQSKRYVYKVYDKKIVNPSEVGVLSTQARPSTATLITCDPPGTALNRLVIVAEQISPDPTKNAPNSIDATAPAPTIVPGNAPTLWNRMYNFFVR